MYFIPYFHGSQNEFKEAQITVLLPCLNEEKTLLFCLNAITEGLRNSTEFYEILVVDNGSTDLTSQIAEKFGARVLFVPEKGYGSALRAGIISARGKWIIMGDSDGSYDFTKIIVFIDQLKSGADLVVGCRMPSGGGTILPGAMPWKHRWIGNPILTAIGKIFFKSKIHDFHCGLRAFVKKSVLDLNLLTTGMEFASEMIIVATISKLTIKEVPIVLHPDLRNRKPHLKSWQDGWRHLRFMLLYSPLWLFLIPCFVLCLFAFCVTIILEVQSIKIGKAFLDINSLLYFSLLFPLCQQLLFFGIFSSTYARQCGVLPSSSCLEKFYKNFSLEGGIIIGVCMITAGLGLVALIFLKWKENNFGALLERDVFRISIPSAILILMGFQFIFGSFVISLLTIFNKHKPNLTH